MEYLFKDVVKELSQEQKDSLIEAIINGRITLDFDSHTTAESLSIEEQKLLREIKSAEEIREERITNLVAIIDGYFKQGGHHLNVNVLQKEKLIEAMENPAKYPNITIRVSGYAVNFHKLSKDQQLEVLKRTYHGEL